MIPKGHSKTSVENKMTMAKKLKSQKTENSIQNETQKTVDLRVISVALEGYADPATCDMLYD